jgi:hypothetical protein
MLDNLVIFTTNSVTGITLTDSNVIDLPSAGTYLIAYGLSSQNSGTTELRLNGVSLIGTNLTTTSTLQSITTLVKTIQDSSELTLYSTNNPYSLSQTVSAFLTIQRIQ